jgi:hypothetical protein
MGKFIDKLNDPQTQTKIKTQFIRTEVTDLDSLPLTYVGISQPVMPQFFSLLSLARSKPLEFERGKKGCNDGSAIKKKVSLVVYL